MSVIRKPFELKVQPYIKVLIYGQPGLRKTTFGLSAPAPLLLDADNGVHRIDPRHQTPTVQVEKWEDIQAVLTEDLSAFKTIVIDTAGKLLDFMTTYIIQQDPKMGKRDGSLALQGYGARKVMFTNFLRQVSDLKKHLVFVAHEKEEKDGDQKIIRPEIGGSSAGDLIKELDLVGYMQSIGSKKTVSFEPCEKFYAKNTCKLPQTIELVNTIEDGKNNTQMEGIFEAFTKSLAERQAMSVNYKTLLDTINGKVELIIDAATANEVTDWASSFDGHIWDSKLQAAFAIRKQAKAIGLTISKERRYENPGAAAATTPADNTPATNGTSEATPPAPVTQEAICQQIAEEAAKNVEEAKTVAAGEQKTEDAKPNGSTKKTTANAKTKQGQLV